MTWRVRTGSSSVPVELSINQRNHLAAAARGERTIWLAATFDVVGPIDVDALTAAYQALVRRHSTLHCEVVWNGADVGAVRRDPRELRCEPSRPAAGEEVLDVLERECSPLSYPAFALAAVSRPDLSTVVCGFDHLHVDGVSIAIVADELNALYADAARQLPPAGCFVSRAAGWAAASPLPGDDPRLVPWRRTLDALDYRLPRFPFPLGLGEGETAPQRTECRTLAGAETVDALGLIAREAGTTTYGALLTTMSRALHALGAPGPTPALVPVQTRQDGDRSTVGWFTTTVPVIAGDDLAVTAANLREVRRGAGLPLDQVLASLPRPLRWSRRDVFMASYVDYRHLPGARGLIAPHHVSATAATDEVQIWLSRTEAELAVRVRLPDTPAASAVVDRFLSRWSGALTRLATGSMAAA